MTPLAYLKAKTDDDREAYLESCIVDAESDIKLYTGLEEVPKPLEPLVMKLALWHYRRDGIEGFDGYSQGGESISIHNLDENDLSVLQRYRVFTIGSGEYDQTDDIKLGQNFDDWDD